MKRFILTAVCVIAAALPGIAEDTLQTSPGALAHLTQTGDRKAALEKIRAGADVNEAQPDGTRPIHWAVYRVDYELLDALIARKAKVDVANEFGATPLAEAAKLGGQAGEEAARCRRRARGRECGWADGVDAGDQDWRVALGQNAAQGRGQT